MPSQKYNVRQCRLVLMSGAGGAESLYHVVYAVHAETRGERNRGDLCVEQAECSMAAGTVEMRMQVVVAELARAVAYLVHCYTSPIFEHMHHV